ncbi:MAG TPA: tetraacyldisaccharide 4'-kinase [Pirellulales bacterium]|nr:tetraacyldisaccharide 4'-kinase [Pirellulales bacterium]
MLGPSDFRDLVSGRRRGLGAAIARAALRACEWPYTVAVGRRNRRFDRGASAIMRVAVPVISVGNITLGGTGKTPTVEWLARWFAEHGVRVALVSRGYGSSHGQPNDEALELAEKLPGVPHVMDARRVRGALAAIEQHDCQLILLDDAFQHRHLARDLDIVLIDASEPFGYGHVFPRGMLREPLAGLARADLMLLTRSQLVAADSRADIRREVARHAPTASWAEADYAARDLRSPTGGRQDLAALAGQPIAAFCGIGNPASFRQSLEACDYRIVAMRELPDHFAYQGRDIIELADWAVRNHAASVVCTRKDLVKIGTRWPICPPLWALSSQLQITTGLPELEARLLRLAARAKGVV